MRRYLNPVIIIGAVLAVCSGLVSYFASNENVALGVVIGLQVQLLAVAVEMLLTQKSAELAAGRLAKLVAGAESVEWLPAVLERICQHAITVDSQYRNTIAPEAAKRLLGATDRELRELAGGVLYVDCYDPSLKLQLLRAPASILRTMSVQSHDLRWHLSDVGRNYWKAQQDALARGWKIRRVFVYDDWTAELDDLAQEQKQAGVEVLRIGHASLPAELRTLDVTVWGDRHAFEHRKMELGNTTVDKFTVDPSDIARYLALFDILEATAERF
jgi:hypothetical protein